LGAHETLEDHHADSDCIVRPISSVRSRWASVSARRPLLPGRTGANCLRADWGAAHRESGEAGHCRRNELQAYAVEPALPTRSAPLVTQPQTQSEQTSVSQTERANAPTPRAVIKKPRAAHRYDVPRYARRYVPRYDSMERGPYAFPAPVRLVRSGILTTSRFSVSCS
jgi:hypothetical protein